LSAARASTLKWSSLGAMVTISSVYKVKFS
jgi:hypothetical protein